MKVFLGIIILLFISLTGISQDKSEIKELFIEAEYYLLYEDYTEALPFYLKIHNLGFSNANIKYRIGLCYLFSEYEKHKSIEFLEIASQYITKEYNEGSFKETHAPEETNYFLGMAYRINNQLDKSIEAYDNFRNTLTEREIANIFFVNQEIKSCHNAKELEKNPVSIYMLNLGEPINTRYPNKNPVISPDEEVIVYTSKQKFYDAVFLSRKKEGKWTNPMNLTPQIGSDGEYYPSSISHDKKSIILFKDDIYGGDLYITRINEHGFWTKAEKLGKNINTKYWETHGCLSPDGQTLYFTSNKKGGYGGLDIYMSKINSDGEWGGAVNLGPEINTPYNEETPFITGDGEKLYFSSKGHYNIGGYDVFYAQKSGENKWSKPLNLGYPINTPDDNLFFSPAQNGKYAYISQLSDRGIGVADIYRMHIPQEETLEEIAIEGIIELDDNVVEFIEDFKVKIIDVETGDTVKSVVPNIADGKYTVNLPVGNYKFLISGKNYKGEEEELYIPEDFSREQIFLKTELTPKSVIEGKYITIKSIYFNFDDYTLSRESKIELEKLFVLMNDYPELKIEVIGHSDSQGPYEYNLWLSKNRANAAIDYLIEKGINKERFISKGEGESNPVAVNFNIEGRKLNRRVEIKVHGYTGNDIVTQSYFIPEHLKIDEQENFYILISNKADNLSQVEINVLNNLQIEYAYEVINNKHTYYIGSFNEKPKAIKMFNNIISLGFIKAVIINHREFNQLNQNSN